MKDELVRALITAGVTIFPHVVAEKLIAQGVTINVTAPPFQGVEDLAEKIRYVPCNNEDCPHNSDGQCSCFRKMPACATYNCVEYLKGEQ